jgi:pyrimidine operon attenuation protein/uracil phosphoribosyltransferase
VGPHVGRPKPSPASLILIPQPTFKDPSREAEKEVRTVSAAPKALPTDAATALAGPEEIARIIDRIAHQILEKTQGAQDVLLFGIPTRGAPLARRLAERIHAFTGVTIPAGVLDVTLYRDDLRLRAPRALEHTDLPSVGVDAKHVILVDDVLYSGRTIRAALDALSDLGRPRAVQLAVLVDRGHRELPIRADYIGRNLPTSSAETVRVLLAEVDGRDGVLLEKGAGPA